MLCPVGMCTAASSGRRSVPRLWGLTPAAAAAGAGPGGGGDGEEKRCRNAEGATVLCIVPAAPGNRGPHSCCIGKLGLQVLDQSAPVQEGLPGALPLQAGSR